MWSLSPNTINSDMIDVISFCQGSDTIAGILVQTKANAIGELPSTAMWYWEVEIVVIL